MSNNKSFTAERYILSKLAADSQLANLVGDRIFADVAPTNAVFPFVTIRYETYNDLGTIDGSRPIQELSYLVVASGKGASYGPLEPIVERIDAILDKTQGKPPSGNGVVLSCTFDGLYKMPYTDETGANYRDIGNRYTLLLQ